MPPAGPPRTLVIACGALAREILTLIRVNGWEHIELACLPANLHNRPGRIADAVRARIAEAGGHFARILVAYADCGTAGALDRVLEETGATRIPGPHCYAMYAGQQAFEELQEAEPGTFYLTDYLARSFDHLVIEGLGLDRHPELLPLYFGNYHRLVYLSQQNDPALLARARDAAERLGLAFEHRRAGMGELATFLAAA